MTPKQIKDAIRKHGSINKAAVALDMAPTTFKRRVRAMERGELLNPDTLEQRRVTRPRSGGVKRYILTSAQSQTPVCAPFWDNLHAYAESLGAEVLVAGFTYNTKSANPSDFAEPVRPYLTNARVNIGGSLLFCGEVNTSPTAVRPLSGMETYTRDKWGVFPHPRVELRSVPTIFSAPSKQIMTTGTVTVPNYIQRKAGVKAEFHHMIGALLVEQDWQGRVFCRHLLADEIGAFYDLDTYVAHKSISHGHPVEAITWGDIHAEQVDKDVMGVSWGANEENLLDTLRPKYQFIHDLADFTARNHHNIRDPHWRFKQWVRGEDSVEDGVKAIAAVLDSMARPGCARVVVESNHDLMMARWLRESSFHTDPANAQFYLEASTALYAAVARGNDDHFSILEWAVRKHALNTQDLTFLREYESFKVNNIEYGLHGHRGANGAKGFIDSFARMGSKANVAHTHAAAIFEGVYQAGTSSKLDLGYNRGGLSSWNHAHIVTYENGKRAMITLQGGKWRA